MHNSIFSFQQIHIDVARNATDDFNLFHDMDNWQRINNNPFAGPIVLGFQLESLVAEQLRQYRSEHNEISLIEQCQLDFSNYQLTFANAVKPGQSVTVDIKKTQHKTEPYHLLSNRISVKSEGKLALIGYQKESQQALFLPDDLTDIPSDLFSQPDRQFLPSAGEFFLKRKYINVSNAKNFLCGSLINQNRYFDELAGKARFPEIFPCSLLSCALLEKALFEKLDFERNPMVYTSHKISIDRQLIRQLSSNDCLHLLVKEIASDPGTNKVSQVVEYHCYGLVTGNKILFRAIIGLCPLSAMKLQSLE